MTSPKVLRHITQETILTILHHGNTILSFAGRHEELNFGEISIESSTFSIDLRRNNFLVIRETTFVLTGG